MSIYISLKLKKFEIKNATNYRQIANVFADNWWYIFHSNGYFMQNKNMWIGNDRNKNGCNALFIMRLSGLIYCLWAKLKLNAKIENIKVQQAKGRMTYNDLLILHLFQATVIFSKKNFRFWYWKLMVKIIFLFWGRGKFWLD